MKFKQWIYEAIQAFFEAKQIIWQFQEAYREGQMLCAGVNISSTYIKKGFNR